MRAAALITTSMVLAGAARAQTAGFWLVGNSPGATSGGVSALSQDGQIAAGASGNGTIGPGFVWTAQAGRYDFGLEPGMPPFTPVAAMSSAGSVLAGYAIGGSFPQHHAYRRVGSGPVQDLGALPNYPFSEARGISGDGSIVVGRSRDLQFDYLGQAFRWTESGGMQGLGYLRPGGNFSRANGISRDGTTIVGVSQSGGPGNPTEGFVWTQPGGMAPLPLVPGATYPDSSARGVSADGSVIVGDGGTPSGFGHAVRWAAGSAQSCQPRSWCCRRPT